MVIRVRTHRHSSEFAFAGSKNGESRVYNFWAFRDRRDSDVSLTTCLCALIYGASNYVCIIYAHV